MRPPGVWSYWTGASGKRIEPDLDDTSLLSFVLRRHHPHVALGSNVEAILASRNRDGLFHTWLRPPDQSNDVDAVVNANVVLHLGERKETAAACDFLRACVLSGQEAGSYWYYVDDSVPSLRDLPGALARGPRARRSAGRAVEKALARQRPDGSFGNELCTAWTLSTLLNAGSDDRDCDLRRGRLAARATAAGRWVGERRRIRRSRAARATHLSMGLRGAHGAACVEALARVRTHLATATVEGQRGLV